MALVLEFVKKVTMNKIYIYFLLLSNSILFSNEIELDKLFKLPEIDNQFYSKIINIDEDIYYINENLDFIIFEENSEEIINLSNFKTYVCDNIPFLYHYEKSDKLLIYSGIRGSNNLIIFDIINKKIDSISCAVATNYARIFNYNDNLYSVNNYSNRFSIGKINIEKKSFEYIDTFEDEVIVDCFQLDSLIYFSNIETKIEGNDIKFIYKLSKFNLINNEIEIIEESEERQYYKILKLENNNFCFIQRDVNYNGLIINYLDYNFNLIRETKVDNIVFIKDILLFNDNLYLISDDKILIDYNYLENKVQKYILNKQPLYILNYYNSLIFVTNDNYIYELKDEKLSIKPIESDNLDIFPNPANNFINIWNDYDRKIEIDIFNSKMNFVKKIEVLPNLTNVDISNLSNGVYFLIYKVDGDFKMQKLRIIK